MTGRTTTWIAGAVAALMLAAAAPAPANAADGPRLTALTSARFPERAYALTLPQERRLAAADVQVLEDGAPVASPSLVPADRLGSRGFGLVLVIDASHSMRGAPIDAAMTAARAFAGRRQADQRLGVVVFNTRAETRLPLTTDQTAIDAALAARPPLAGGTAINDAALAGVEMLAAQRITGGSVVLLSDGADTSSRAATPAVLDAAKRAGARIFTVGLQSSSYRSETLEQLAGATGGSYALASSPRRLEAIFGRLGAALSRQYLLRYRSLAGPSERVTVQVHVGGRHAPATTAYTSPALRLAPEPPFERALGDVFWLSPAAALIAALACGLLVGAIVLVLLRRRGGGLLERIRQFVPILDHEGAESRPAARSKPADRSGTRVGAWARLEEDLDIAGIRVSARRLALATVAGTAVAMWLFATLADTGGAALIGLAVPVAVRAFVKVKAMRQRRVFADQLADNVQVIASAMRAGHSFVGALSVVVEDAPEPSRREFLRVVNDERLGKPIEASFRELAARMGNDELDHIGLVARLQTQTGGNTAEVLDRLVETLRSRADLRRLVRTLTAQGRLGGWVVSGLPVAVLAAMSVLNPSYAQKIFATGAGHVMLVLSATLIVLGSLVIRRIVDIKV
jgi:tight adherence protein B